jgi:hypothetical protein
MRKTFIPSFIAITAIAITGFFMGSCNNSQKTAADSTQKDSTVYGEKFDKNTAIDIDSALAHWQDHTKSVVVKGTSSAVCQTEGCWFKYKTSSEELFVDFDHQFKIAKNSVGKTLFATGYFYQDTVSVEMLQEYAKDDGKTSEEIASIKEPQVELHFRATGVDID